MAERKEGISNIMTRILYSSTALLQSDGSYLCANKSNDAGEYQKTAKTKCRDAAMHPL